jgi:CubicO group peptidase (beta-lactamase class C family)
MFWKLISLLVCLTSVQAQMLTFSRAEEVGISSERLSRIDAVVYSAIKKNEVPGAVILVTRRGKIVYRKAFGDRSLVPAVESMTVDTIFDMASLTKVMVTATSIMILVEEGKIALTDSASEYLPRFARYGKGAITLLQLLTHHSGLRPDIDLDDSWQGYASALERVYREQLLVLPGKKFVYSDINYLVLAEIIQRISGKSLHEFSSERIFKPLGMLETGFMLPHKLHFRVAPTEFREGKLLRGEVHDPTAFRMGGEAGHAGLFSTPGDTAIYAQMILNQGSYGGVRILSPLSVLKMTTSQSPVGSENWRGVGFDIRTSLSTNRGDLFPIGSFGHTGFTGTSFWIDPSSEVAVLVFTSRLHPDGQGNVTPLRKRIASVVAASLIDTLSLGKLY